MSAWTDFVKTHYAKVKHLPNKERLGALSKMYKGGAVSGGAVSGGKLKRGKKMTKGGGLLGSIIPFANLLGL